MVTLFCKNLTESFEIYIILQNTFVGKSNHATSILYLNSQNIIISQSSKNNSPDVLLRPLIWVIWTGPELTDWRTASAISSNV
jgi:hypothetical protein